MKFWIVSPLPQLALPQSISIAEVGPRRRGTTATAAIPLPHEEQQSRNQLRGHGNIDQKHPFTPCLTAPRFGFGVCAKLGERLRDHECIEGIILKN